MSNRISIVQDFLATGEKFVDLVQPLNDEQLNSAAEPDEWTLRQIIHHVADDADVWSFAFKKAIAAPGSPLRFEGFPGNEKWTEALDFAHRPVTDASMLILTHWRLMAEIACSLPEETWDQAHVEVFDDKGQSMGNWGSQQIFEMLTDHLREHLHTIQAVLHNSITSEG